MRVVLVLVGALIGTLFCIGDSSADGVSCTHIPTCALLSAATGVPDVLMDARHLPPPQTEEKKRVPKDDRKRRSEKSDDDDDDDSDNCIFDLLCGIFDIMSLSDSDSDEPGKVVVVEPPVVAPGEVRLRDDPIGAEFTVDPIDMRQANVVGWSAPGGEKAGGDILCRFPRGVAVRVFGTAYYDDATWFSVPCADAPDTRGWVRAGHLVRVEEESLDSYDQTGDDYAKLPSDPDAEQPSLHIVREPMLPDPIPDWQISFHFSPAWSMHSGSEELTDYIGLHLRAGLGVKYFPSSMFTLGFRTEFAFNDGDPEFDYETSTTFDSPTDSNIRMFVNTLLVGMHIPLDDVDPIWLTIEAGPAVYRVKERADITYRTFDGG
ncbi:hypothetical protein ACFL6M_07335, partial [Candidatus Eisenbacteria bacterium]